MLQKYNTYRILGLFFDQPTKGFQLREISRMLKLGMPWVKSHIERLEKFGLVAKEKKGVYPSYKASRNEKFRLYKRNDMLLRLHESDLIENLVNEALPNAIIFFGSASRGEDIETSDIDLMILAKEKDIKLEAYEKHLKRKIQLFFEPDAKKIPKEFMNNIINGIVIYGYLKVL